ncbi:MAG: cell division protein [Gallionellales bacterium RIFCSPLOWO2_12_FULL_59_22]|nr:MAG: cell division protein [Gallionellales bacterium RIFCSPLOWO2_02_FULL_59_110]OGT13302.1 MAG: cell division protein [Gallionellales bacterium RIFCSPLOWO2_12_FULL_59_22]
MNYASSAHPDITAELPGWRATALFMLLLLGLLGLLGRGVYLQGIHDGFLQEKGNARYSRVIEVGAHRGMLTDRNGIPLAVSTPVESAWASPDEVEADSRQVKQLAQVLGMNVGELKSRLFDTSRDFVYLKRHLPPDQAEKVVGLNLPGISLQREYRRYYPAGEAVAQTLGFTGQDDNGQEGLELALQERLGGKSGSQRVIKDRRGHIVEDAGNLHAPKPGSDIALSLDSRVQHLAYRELSDAVKQHRAKSGAVVVLDARSGEVLALANYPAYNPNNRSKASSQMLRNRAIVDLFEPGSTMKPFTVACAIEQGKVRPESIINTERGVLTVGNKKIRDTHPEPMLTVAQIIQKSSNIGSAKIALSLEAQTLWQSLADSGFGAQTGSNFPGEASGRLRDAKTWQPIEQATMSYGHGISVSLLQLARAYTVFASDGELKPVSLLKLNVPALGKRVFSGGTAQALRAMLESVVQPGGTAPLAQVAGYRVAGKTGTAHKLENGRYIDRYVASFVGFAPVSDPRLIVAVMIDEPANGHYYGGLVAAPVFSKVTGAALHALNVPNDAPLDNVIAPPTDIVREEV